MNQCQAIYQRIWLNFATKNAKNYHIRNSADMNYCLWHNISLYKIIGRQASKQADLLDTKNVPSMVILLYTVDLLFDINDFHLMKISSHILKHIQKYLLACNKFSSI